MYAIHLVSNLTLGPSYWHCLALRNPPRPTAAEESKDSDLLLTIEQFWLKNYWKHMKLENLTLFYEFPIHASSAQIFKS